MKPKQARKPDRRTAGRSKVVEYREGESWEKRHRRRLGANMTLRDLMQIWCDVQGFKLRITNNDHHWQIRMGVHGFAEWWPSSAKLVINKQWKKGVHVHDVFQAMHTLNDHIRANHERAKKRTRQESEADQGSAV